MILIQTTLLFLLYLPKKKSPNCDTYKNKGQIIPQSSLIFKK